VARKRVNKICSRCENPAVALGFCSVHYADSRKHLVRPSSGLHDDEGKLPVRKPFSWEGSLADSVSAMNAEEGD
jgi:hypothetical protein